MIVIASPAERGEAISQARDRLRNPVLRLLRLRFERCLAMTVALTYFFC